MSKNVGQLDQVVRIVAGLALIAFGLWDQSAWRWIGLAGPVLAATAFIRFCPAYALFGLRTCSAMTRPGPDPPDAMAEDAQPGPVLSGLLAAFPRLADLQSEARSIVQSASTEISLAPGLRIFEPGQSCDSYLLIRRGGVRVHLLEAEGHEIVLYRIGPGETCILTTAALLDSGEYPAWAVTEVETEATSLPARAFHELLDRDAVFRRFVFASHARRIMDLMRVVTNIAFTRISVRLARCLLAQADAAGRVNLTHEALAVEIGTAREVVTRNLQRFRQQGLVQLGQGFLTILDKPGLALLTAGEGEP